MAENDGRRVNQGPTRWLLAAFGMMGLVLFVCLGFIVLWFCFFKEETYQEIENPSVKLIDTFDSYSSIAQTKSQIPADLAWVFHKGTVADNRPYRRVDDLIINDFPFLGQSGQLRLTFFNDRLMCATFYPVQIDKFVQIIKEKGIDLTKSSELKLMADLTICTWTEFGGRPYVRWSDDRLIAQHDRWIRRYSMLGSNRFDDCDSPNRISEQTICHLRKECREAKDVDA
jgi:hypothetical protein